ncbi:MAG: hypothetical protein ACK4RK_02700 [Gemmataceae bacterium]
MRTIMFGDGSLTFREFAMREPLPLAVIHDAVLEFLCGRTFPELKTTEGPIVDCLRTAGASEKVLAAWQELVAEEIVPEGEDDKFA